MRKLALNLAVIIILAGCILGAILIIDGNYLKHNSINGIIILLLLGLTTGFIIRFRKYLLSLVLIATMFSCDYAKSNQQVVTSEDCGKTWKQVESGESVPKGGVNPCYMKVIIPNYPMQGDANFVANLKARVRVEVEIDYDYSIIKPLAFIKEAKFLGKTNAHADTALDSTFEMAENMVVDKRLRDVSKAIFLKTDILEFDQGDLEATLLLETNKVLHPLGIQLNFLTLTFDLDEQSKTAIDVVTAIKIYEAKGEIEFGRQVILKKAGKIIIE